jgi:hypothetical protein
MNSTSPNSSANDLISLKAAAQDLGLSNEGLRRRLIRVGAGTRVGARWFIPAQVVVEMRDTAERAAKVLWGRRE